MVAEPAFPLVLWFPGVFTPGRLILAEPSKEIPPIVRAVVNLVAVATLLTESAVLSTLGNPTSVLVSVTTPVLPATDATSPDVILTYPVPLQRYVVLPVVST